MPAAGSREAAGNGRVAVFEELCQSHRRSVAGHIRRRDEVCFIRLNRSAEGRKWVGDLIERGILRKIEFGLRPHIFDGFYYDAAYDNIDAFTRGAEEKILLKGMIELYENPDIMRIYRKAFNERLGRFYYLNYALAELTRKFEGRKIIFRPYVGIDFFCLPDRCEIYDYIRLARIAEERGITVFHPGLPDFYPPSIAMSYLNAAARRLAVLSRVLGVAGWILLSALRSIFLRGRNEGQRHYKYAVMITSPDRQFANMVQKVDFLIDGRLIKKDEALFLSCKKLRPENRKYMESAGLAYIDEPSGTISMGEMTRALGLFFLTARRCLKEESLALDTALRAVYFYIVWKSLAERVDIGRLISCADFGQQSVARNIILENDGCETYYYLDSANLGCFKARKDLGAGYRHNIYSFLHYTYFVSWNDFISEYFRSMACGVKEYLNFGCLWAEHLRLISDGQIDSNLKKVLRRKDPERKRRIVSVFDCGMHDHFMNTYEYGIEFLNGILHLIKSLPDIFVVFKEKKPRPYHKKISHRFTDILDLYSRLENHERCYFVSSSGNPSEIIASSDITISMPFTSTTFEAVSALRKAIYYDPDGRFADTYYYGIPGLVCRDSDGLPERVRHLLEMSGEEYARYINEHVRGKIEDYMDCRAITRLREHLSGVPA